MKREHGIILDQMPEKHQRELAASYDKLIELARQARTKEAFSYRQFLVGAAALTFNPERGIYHTVKGGNKKTQPGFDPEKKCAEAQVIERVEEIGDEEIVAIAICCKETQPDVENGVTSTTLHPCKSCQELFAKSKIVKPWTQIITINDSGQQDPIISQRNVVELVKLHQR